MPLQKESVMNMMEKNDTAVFYKREYLDTLDKIWLQPARLSGIKYFLDTEYAWAEHKADPRVVILGTDIPEELVYAAGAEPYWLTGGSLASIAWSDDAVPRDTDPVSRSILGYINRPGGTDFSGALFIIPMTNDSMRKIAYQLKAEGRKLCLVDIPPDRADRRAEEKWQRQMLEMTEKVTAHTKSRMKRSMFASEAERVMEARAALTAFLNVSGYRPDLISDTARLLIRDSYYRTDNIDEWTCQLKLLTEETAKRIRHAAFTGQGRPNVIVMGSPVIFPNYKIPFLINEVGLNLTECIDSSFLKQYLVIGRKNLTGSRERMIRTIASAWYANDASPAYIRNDSLFRYVSWLVQNRDIEGVVYHVLKGQIEYDFELERFETLFAEYGIPVFRLETDYSYQDIEQLRIRLEAFTDGERDPAVSGLVPAWLLYPADRIVRGRTCKGGSIMRKKTLAAFAVVYSVMCLTYGTVNGINLPGTEAAKEYEAGEGMETGVQAEAQQEAESAAQTEIFVQAEAAARKDAAAGEAAQAGAGARAEAETAAQTGTGKESAAASNAGDASSSGEATYKKVRHKSSVSASGQAGNVSGENNQAQASGKTTENAVAETSENAAGTAAAKQSKEESGSAIAKQSKEETEATKQSEETVEAVINESSKRDTETVIAEQPEENQQMEEIAVAAQVPSLEEYLSKKRCGGCGHGCSLLNPRCMRGARKQSTAQSEYDALYGNG